MQGTYKNLDKHGAMRAKSPHYCRPPLSIPDTGFSISTTCFLSDDESNDSMFGRKFSVQSKHTTTSSNSSEPSTKQFRIRKQSYPISRNTTSFDSFETDPTPLGVYSTLPKNFKKSDSLTWEIYPGASNSLHHKNHKILAKKTISLPLKNSFDIFNDPPKKESLSKNLPLCPKTLPRRMTRHEKYQRDNFTKNAISAPLDDFRHVGHIGLEEEEEDKSVIKNRNSNEELLRKMKSYSSMSSAGLSNRSEFSPVILSSIPIEKALKIQSQKLEKFVSSSSGIMSGTSGERYRTRSCDSSIDFVKSISSGSKASMESLDSFGQLDTESFKMTNLLSDVLGVMDGTKYRTLVGVKNMKKSNCSDVDCSIVSTDFDELRNYPDSESKKYEFVRVLSRSPESVGSSKKTSIGSRRSYNSTDLVPVLEETHS